MTAAASPPTSRAALLGVALVSSLLTAGLTRYLLTPHTAPAYQPVAVLTSTHSEAAWIVSADPAHHHLQVRVLPASLALPRTLDLQLWAKGKTGDTVSLGLLHLTDGATELPPLTLGQVDAVRHARSLLISAEPLGGAITPTPSGPVLYRGKFKG